MWVKWMKEVKSYKLPIIKINKSCNAQYGDYSLKYCVAYLKVHKIVDLKSSHLKKNNLWPLSKNIRTINAGEDVKQKELSSTLGGNVD